MKRCLCIFDSQEKGFACLILICVLPFVSPLISFILGQNDCIPFIMIIVANAGILYEFHPWDKSITPVDRVRRERLSIRISAIIFLCICFFIIMYMYMSGLNCQPIQWINFLLLLYVVPPLVATIIEIVYSYKLETKDSDNDGKNSGTNSNTGSTAGSSTNAKTKRKRKSKASSDSEDNVIATSVTMEI